MIRFSNSLVAITFTLLACLNAGNVQAQQPGVRRTLGLCQEVKPLDIFDIDAYASKRWFVQEQQRTSYSFPGQTCVRADYKVLDSPTSPWQYSVEVNNQEGKSENNGDPSNPLCAYQVVDGTGQLEVSPCFLPKFFGGDYWVVAYEEGDEDGYALVSGGQPKIVGDDGVLCRTGTGYYNSGLWIFTRKQERDEELVDRVKDIANGLGIDTSELFQVDQSDC